MGIRMEVNAAQFYKWRALKYCAAEGRNRRQHGEAARMAGFPLNHGKFFRQLKRIFVNSVICEQKTKETPCFHKTRICF